MIGKEQFHFIERLVYEKSAIVLDEGKEYLVETRLSSLMRTEGIESFEELIQQLRKPNSRVLEYKVIEAMTTNETTFFRDLNPFTALRKDIMPELIERNAASRTINIWCAASSTGQEPYSLAMLMKEDFPQLDLWNVNILASDISEEVLGKARKGVYSQLEVNRGLPAPYLVKYFKKEGIHWGLSERIRSMVEYKKINLIEPWPALPTFDLIFIRNVLIYFDVETKRRVLEKMRRVLSPNGYLFLGGAETTLNVDNAYTRVTHGKSSSYRIAS